MNHTFMKAMRAVIVMTVTMLSGSNAMADGVVVKGNVYGGGNAADVQVNTTVNISAGRVEGNVYGGGNLGDVGRINRNLPDYNYKWTDATVDPQNPQENYTYNSTGVCNVNITGSTVLVGPVGENATADKDHGNVFGGGKGDDNSLFYCEKGMVYSTNVIISAGTVKGTVFGGGEVGRVENNTIVTIGEAGANGNTSTPVINGDVFGAGKGLKTHGYSALVRGNPVVTVQGKTLVGGSVYGGGEIASVGKHKVKTSNNPLTPDDAPEDLPVGMPYTLANTNLGKCTVTIKDNVTITNNVFGAGQGIDDYSYNDSFQRMGMSDWESFADAAAYHVFLQTLALATDTHVSIEGNANVNGSVFGGSESGFVQYDTNVMIKGGVIGTQGDNTTGDVYGGGRGLTNNIIAGRVNGNTNVNILGGTIRKDVYGGAALAKSNAKSTSSSSGGENPTTTVTYPTATVNLLGGIIGGDAYGGGLGNANTAADVGNTKVNLNGIDKSYYDASDATMKALFDPLIDKSSDLNGYPVIRTTETTVKGAIVNQVFGANNTNGTPLGGVTVHVFGTQNVDYANISAKVTCPVQGENETAKDYLGRLLAAATSSTDATTQATSWLTGTNSTTLNAAETTYNDNAATTEAINTAIANVKAQLDNVYDVAAVYGGGNNANYTPDAQIAEASRTTNVIIEGCDFSSIKNVYGGGNAAAAPATDVLILGTKIIDNLFGGGNGELGPEYAAHVGYYRTGSGTTTDYTIGTGKTYVKLVAGNIHNVYGGSNSNGDIRGGANTIMPSKDDYTAYNCCDNLITQNVYGGGKNADMSSGTSVVLGCMPDDWIDEIYAGSQEANVEGDVNLTITSGKFERVFGGNKTSGMIKGSITVNIEETTSCGTPIVIGELYGGGNQADYSIYGYDGDQPRKKADYDTWFATLSAEEKAKPENQPYNNPKLNVRAFTSIGAIYGGGYSAEMVADPTVNINVVKGSRADDATLHTGTDYTYPAVSSPTTIPTTPILGLPYPVHKKDEIGIIGNVFGGGNLATVYGSTTVNIGTESTLDFITEPSYLGTKGTGEETLETTGVAYIVNANGTFKTKVEGVNITENVYGGGNQANVTGNTQVNICEKEVTVGENLVWQSVTPGTAGVTIGGNVFGAGKGVITDVTKALVVGNGIVKMGGGSVKKSVYGGGELSQVGGNTDITVSGGTIGTSGEGGATYGNIYGGGFGTDTYGTGANDATIADYKLFGLIKGNTNITVSGGDILHNVYGGGAYGSVGEFTYDETTGMPTSRKDNTSGGIANVTITGGTIGTTGQENGMVFGSSRGNVAAPIDNVDPNDRLAWVYNANVVIGTSGVTTGPLIYGSLYGSGENGHTFNNTNVTLHSGTIGVTTASEATNITEGGKTYSGAEYPNRGNVYGGGCGTDTYSGTVTEVVEGNSVTKTVDMFNPLAGIVRGNATITITGGTVAHNVYGAGAMGSVGKFEKDATTKVITFTNGTGTTTIAISGGTIGVSGTVGDGNVFGAARGNAAVTGRDFALVYETDVTISGTTTTTQIKGNVYGGGEVGNVHTNTKVDIQGGAIARNVFGGGKGLEEFAEAGKVKGNTEVAISAGSINGNVYGGGQRGITLGNVDVDITGGIVEKDVYGGGALADTNVGNWDADGYTEVTDLSAESSVTGLYTRTESGGNYTYTEITDENATYDSGTTYYSKGKWADATLMTRKYTTTVDLTGGTVKGDAYGGGLGQKTGFNNASSNIEAVVWGDIDVNLGSNASGSSATAFYLSNYSGAHEDVVKSGRVFGCNNLNGSPKGDVTVTVWKTVQGNVGRTTDSDHDGKPDKSTAENPVTPTYELAAVYGGGNLADYNTTGKKAHVRIMTCDVSIQDVYGGGNAAKVPGTVVRVYGAYEIQEVFGGGNGKDPYTTDDGTNWVDNPGADIDGSANTLLTGGYIHEAYGGSNKKGTITGNVQIDIGTEGSVCDLDVEKMVGAGKDADVNGDLIMVLGCKPNTTIPVLYAGADNANVNGDVELTITSGKYGKVFGGNNAGGIIMGHIVLNIEETGECGTPIEIDELYLGGNEAMYSQYGYYKDGTTYKARTAAMAAITDPTADGYVSPVTAEQYDGVTIRKTAPYDPPVLNIVSCTRIGKVFGGGLGVGARLYGDPTVNINMIPGNNTNGVATIMTEKGFDKSKENLDRLGVIGDVYGGGNKADIEGNTTVNIGTASTVQLHLEYENGSYSMSGSQPVKGAYIVGNVYGGGKGEAKLTEGNHGEAFLCAKAMVNGNTGTHVNIGNGMVRGNVYGGGEVGRVENNTVVTIGLAEEDVPQGETSSPVINGNVFGAGKGVDTHGYSALVRGTSTVTVQADAKVRGNVYGGGEIASVGKYILDDNGLPQVLDDSQNSYSGYCYVTIKGNAEIGRDDMLMYNTTTGKPDDYGHVFGAGKGVLPYEFYTSSGAVPLHMDGIRQNDGSWVDHYKEYPAYNPSADLDTGYKNFIKSLALATETLVTIEGNPFIKGSVYGGSENGYVQKDSRVVISGGQIGNGYVQMDDDGNYLATKYSVNRRYSDEEWAAGHLIKDGETNYAHSLPECASWPYGETITVPSGENTTTTKTIYAPYDKYAMITVGHEEEYEMAYDVAGNKSTNGGRRQGSDGHTFYGNVFGGGSGYYPYKPGRWFEDAGAVYGNTYVTIKGGHILTSVYGGNEMTDVGKYADNDQLNLTSGGSCYVTMIGGTLGVPRTLKQIEKHPVTCYLFGAGKGDQRVFFNKLTNVGNVYVHISDDARIYGSVFGGGEDGHVMKNVEMNIGGNTLPAVYSSSSTDEVLKALNLTAQGTKPVETSEGTITHPYIGTWGTSYVDGNVFGGGRGFGGDAYTAGNVAGTVTMNIYGGTMLGSVYGGGRLGSVGYGLFDAKTSTGGDMPGYGEMRPDNTTETESGNSESLDSFNRGHVDITISGGTIGNKWEFVDVDPSTTPANLATWKTNHNVPNTEYEEPKVVTTDNKTLYYYQLKHTKGGNVFAGGMGRQKQIDGQTLIDPEKIDWKKLGNVKQTTLTITGGKIMSNVYGGGELGAVVPYVNGNTVEGGTTQINISGTAVIGTLIERSVTTTGEGGSDVTTKVPVYTFGSVFGGGMGNETDKTSSDDEARIGGLVKGSTTITMSAGEVKGSVYGGGEMAVVQGNHTTTDSKTVGTEVSISGGIIGYNRDGFGGATMGNVYGGGKGSLATANAGLIKNNTLVKITGTPTIYHNIYGGGAYGSVGTFDFTTGIPENWTDGTGKAEVIVEGGTIGINGHENGMVFGSSRGDVAAPVAPSQGATPVDPNDRLAWVYDTHVVIGNSSSSGGPFINGTIYGSGENGHTFTNALVDVNKGTIGIKTGEEITYTEKGKSLTKGGAAYPYRGNVYGGGCGTDMYDSNGDGTTDTFNPLAGIVLGNATVNINGGTVVRNVYGAGAMGSVGKTTTTEGVTTVSGGTTYINVSGGTIGVDGTNGDGNVFGAARGNENATINEFALVKKETSVSVTGGTIKGNVYGGGELGCVGTFTVSPDMRTFTWQNTDGVDNTTNTTANGYNKNTGVCNVTVDGSSAVINGHVYGAGRGKDDTFWCEKGIAYSTNVNIKNGTVNQNVYGGGEVGRVETDTQVKIGNGTGTAGGTIAPTITGSVFGGGAGVETHGYSALVRRNTTVTVEGNADVRKSIYGGGMIASVGRYGLDEHDMPSILQGGGYCYVTVQGSAQIGEDVFGAGKGVTPVYIYSDSNEYNVRMNNSKRMVPYSPYNETTKKGQKESDWKKTWDYVEDYPEDYSGIKFVWEYFDELPKYSTYLETLALATHPEVTIDGNATVSGSVFGGGELGLTKGSVIVTIKGGTIEEDVYGGGSLANTNTTSTVDLDGDGTTENIDPTTTVNLKSGTINRNVYGGGLGQLAKNAENGIYYTAEEAAAYNTEHNLIEGDEGYKTTSDWRVEPVEATSAVEAKVYGEVLVKLNEPTTTTTGEGESSTTTTTYGDCVVKGTIFGCNNLNGSPQKDVTVHVYKTMPRDDTNKKSVNKDNTTYDLAAVYGGGNLASFCPDNVTSRGTAKANVIIDGCDLTSIETVYGGGNAAPAPATHVEVNSCYEIGTVFGGGNGKDALADGTENPGADVGYITNSEGTGKESYGTGVALAELRGGTIHKAFGGSNTKGNVRTSATVDLNEPDPNDCPLRIEEVYGAGNEADQDGTSNINLGCISYLSEIYGGAKNADVNSNVELTIQSGHFDRVFGGNNLGGCIRGSITVNIEETGCHPIVIGQLFGGGNKAGYSVRGYKQVTENGESVWKPREVNDELELGMTTAYDDPQVNVKSFTSIGEIYGGGYGESAVIVGNTNVNVNVAVGENANMEMKQETTTDPDSGESTTTTTDVSEHTGEWIHFGVDPDDPTKTTTVWQPEHKRGEIGTIGNVFGGGNEAPVHGSTNIIIGNQETVTYVSMTEEVDETDEQGNPVYESDGITPKKKTVNVVKHVVGANITGNVYGGGNAADVTGDTNVIIGKDQPTTTP